MKVVALATLAVVAVTVVFVYGYAHRRVVYNESPDIYRTRNHHYSVGQVEVAFLRQGVQLHKAHLPKTYEQFNPPVVLRSGSGRNLVSGTNFVTVAIVRSEADHADFFGAPKGTPRPLITRHGDLIVFYDSGHSAAVKSALAELR
jgi:hypothetical protein